MTPGTNTLTLAEAAELLGVHYMTAYRYVRTGRLPARKVGQEWQVARRDVEALGRAGGDRSTPGRGRRRDRSGALVERMTRSDEAGAWTIVDDAVVGGMEPERVYLDLLAPALHEVGRRWERGDISVAEEHQASTVALRLIGRLGPRFARRGRKRGTVVVGAPPGDVHGLPSALLADVLRGRRFDVVDLGADVPAASWSSTCRRAERLVAAGLCASTADNDDAVRAALDAIRDVSPSLPIVLGGGAVADEAHALALGATVYSPSFDAAVAAFDDLPPR
jgi:excisionase family DNA binding protein